MTGRIVGEFQLDSGGEHEEVIKHEHDRREGEERPENVVRIAAERVVENDEGGGNDAHEVVEIVGRTVLLVAVREEFGAFVELGSLEGFVRTETPCDHVGDQRGDGKDDKNIEHGHLRAAEHATQLLQSVDEAVDLVDIGGVDRGENAKRAEAVEERDGRASDDRHLGNGFLGIIDLGADGTDQLKAEQVVNDRANVGYRIVHGWNPVGNGEVIGKAVLYAVGDTHEAEDQEDAHLDDRHDVRHENGELDALHADVNDDPAHRNGDDRLHDDAHLGEQG